MNRRTLRPRRHRLLFAGLGFALFGAAGSAQAGDAGSSPSGTSISYGLAVPRFVAGSDASAPAHFNSYSPWAINYDDCVGAVDLQFTLDLTGAPAGDVIEVWAGSGEADCTEPSARTAGASSDPGAFPGRCWPAAPPATFDPSGSTSTGRLHVRDLVAYIGRSNPPVTYSAAMSSSVCVPSATVAAVPLKIYFMFLPTTPVGGSLDGGIVPAVAPPDGISGLYPTTAALVGPFAPQDVSVPIGDITPTTLTVSWEPQSEAIIQGYNIYVQDQGVNGVNTGVVPADASPTTVVDVECHPRLSCDAGASPTKDAGTSDAGSGADGASADGSDDDATADAQVQPTGCDAGFSDAWVGVDAAAFAGQTAIALAAVGCEYTNPVNTKSPVTQSTTCVSGPLQSVFTVDAGLGSVVVGTSDAGTSTLLTVSDASADASADSGDTGATTPIGTTPAAGTVPETAGISNISSSYFNSYQAGASVSSYTVTGLTTGHQYAVAVAAVDSYGNVGPIGIGCSTPTAVDDFYSAYLNDGGRAGGGYCSLGALGAPTFGSLFGLGLTGAAVLFARRRRQQGRTS